MNKLLAALIAGTFALGSGAELHLADGVFKVVCLAMALFVPAVVALMVVFLVFLHLRRPVPPQAQPSTESILASPVGSPKPQESPPPQTHLRQHKVATLGAAWT